MPPRPSGSAKSSTSPESPKTKRRDTASTGVERRTHSYAASRLYYAFLPLDLPIRKQHPLRGMSPRDSLVPHAQIGPAHAIAAREEAAGRVVVSSLAADRDATDAGLRRGRFDRADCGIEGGVVPGGELQHPPLVARATVGERRGVPDGERVHDAAALDERRIAEAELGGEQDLAREVDPGHESAAERPHRVHQRILLLGAAAR